MTVRSQYRITGSTRSGIVASVETGVEDGALRPGDDLPPVRALASQLAVSPATVAAAYRDLRARGVTFNRPRRGVQIAHRPPLVAPPATDVPDGVVDLAQGNPDPALAGAVKFGEGDEAGAPARQILFELKEPPSQPLRLFFGNAKVDAPHYDFEKQLPLRIPATPVQTSLSEVLPNRQYEPEPLPLTERAPWLIYIVLAASSIALGFVLFSLARTATRLGTQQPSD